MAFWLQAADQYGLRAVVGAADKEHAAKFARLSARGALLTLICARHLDSQEATDLHGRDRQAFLCSCLHFRIVEQLRRA